MWGEGIGRQGEKSEVGGLVGRWVGGGGGGGSYSFDKKGLIWDQNSQNDLFPLSITSSFQ